MKKLFTILLILCVGISQAQNFQGYYGYGNDQGVNMITLEIYKPLEDGVFYYMNDFKMDKNGYFESYTEVSKYWNIGKRGISGTVQYNAGIYCDDTTSFRIDPVYLGGIQTLKEFYGWTLSLDILFRYEELTRSSGIQGTFIFIKEWKDFTFSGYCDIWNSGLYDPDEDPTVIMFEPQVFYSISKRFSIGIEGRVSNYTLARPYEDYIMLGLKWDLENE